MSDSCEINLRLPPWLPSFLKELPSHFPSKTERMELVIALSRRNVEENTGGPFGAAVFETESGRLVAPGVNLVLTNNTSLAHAESIALMLAQQRLRSFSLGSDHLPAMELVTSSQPCIQCFGNTWWSGVTSLVIGARAEDVETITDFREGPLPPGWVDLLSRRPAPLQPIRVHQDLLRQEACDVLTLYRDSGGLIYNA